MLAPVRTVAPAATPVSLAEAKAHLKVESTDEDTLITSLIEAATSWLDGYTGILGRALITQTWRRDFDSFGAWRLPVGDVIALSSISYYDTDNASQTLASSVYQVLTDEIGPYLALKVDQSWPSYYSRDDAVRVTWTAGYGPNAADVPQAIRQAMLLMIGDWYRSRENTVIGDSASELPLAVKALLAPFRKFSP